MNEIKIFENAEFGTVRTMSDEQGNAWFVGKDVASILGYKNAPKALQDHVLEEDITKRYVLDARGVRQQTIFINESGLYSLILSSKLEKAREFKHWVTAEVLPQIRQTGGYIPVAEADDEKTILSKALLIMQKTIEQKNQLLEEQKPQVQFAEAVSSCQDSILIRDLAKLITQNGYKIGQARLFYWLRLHGYLFKNETRPIQKWVEIGLFDTNITLIETHHGTKERCTTKVTGKGQRYFIDGFMNGRFHAENGNF